MIQRQTIGHKQATQVNSEGEPVTPSDRQTNVKR